MERIQTDTLSKCVRLLQKDSVSAKRMPHSNSRKSHPRRMEDLQVSQKLIADTLGWKLNQSVTMAYDGEHVTHDATGRGSLPLR